MTGPASVTSKRHDGVWCAGGRFSFYRPFAGCSRLWRSPAARDLAICRRTDAPAPPSQSNLDVADRSHPKASRGSASLQYARLGLADAGNPEAGARRFQQGDQPRSRLRAGLRQPRPALSPDRQARSRACRLQQGAVDRRQLRRQPISAAASIYRQQGRSAQALADFNKAIALRPDNAQAYYNRGLLYQSQRQHQFAIDDFTTALGLTTQRDRSVRGARAQLPGASATPNRRRAISTRRCRSQPRNLQAWASRGLAYERLGQKDKAAGSYAKALNINDKYEPAKTGFARVGGKAGQSYQTF